jgi:membrane-associated phospholipid phosphatase
MIALHFNLQLVQFFADHRNPFLTRLFTAASFFGTADFYFLLTILLYVVWDKREAIRLSVLILLTMAFNDVLKMLIGNPRPFVREGTYPKKWAVSPAEARSLAAEYSTPSGHAMGSSAFYSYLFAAVKNRLVRAILVLAIVLIGVSRPYLGVHYVEDVLFGWAMGLTLTLCAVRYAGRISSLWARCAYGWQIAIAAAASMVLCLVTVALHGGRIDGDVGSLAIYGGLLTGVIIARPLELRLVNFDPRSLGPEAKVLRYVLTVTMTVLVLFALKDAFRFLAEGETPLGCALDYLRYAAANVAAFFLGPLVFCKLKLAERVS